MKKLWPEQKSDIKKLSSTDNSFHLTEEAYNEIISAIQRAYNKAQAAQTGLDDYKQQLSDELLTELGVIDNLEVPVKAEILEAAIQDLTTQDFTASSGSIEALTAGQLSSVRAAIQHLVNVESAGIDTVTASTGNITTLNATEINADHANIENYSVSNADIDTLSSTEADIGTANITTADIASLASDSIDVAELTGNRVTIDDLTAPLAKLTKFSYEFSHNDKGIFQQVDEYATGADGDYWIVLPAFLNGTYFLIAENAVHDKLWSMEIDNSTKNISFSWSVADSNKYLQDIEVIEDSTSQTQFIQIHARTYSLATKLYHRADSFDTDIVPDIYSVKQYDGTKDFTIDKASGIWLPNAVFAGEFHADTLEIDNVEFDNVTVNTTITLPLVKDQYGDVVSHTTGNIGDYITNTEDEFGNIGVQWQSPAADVERGNEHLITSDAVSNYDGEVDNPDYDEDDPTSEEHLYPVTHLGNNTTVHGSLTVNSSLEAKESAKLPNFYNGTEADFDPNEMASNSIVIFTEVDDPSDYIAGKIYRYRIGDSLEAILEEVIASTDKDDQKPVIYDEATNSYKTVDGLDITEINVDELHANKAYIKELDTVKEETIASTGDYVVLRANNSAAMANTDRAGILIHNYDGNGNDAALVSDNTGVVRVGTGTPASVVYAVLYFDKTTEKYYTDIEDPSSEVTPVGALTSWASKDDTTDYIEYTDAAFSVIDYSSLEPLLTRDEANGMTDKGLIRWDAEGSKAKTIAVPTLDEQTLTSHITPGATTTVYTDGTSYYDNDFTVATEPEGTAGTPHTIGDFAEYNGHWYEKGGSSIYYEASSFTGTGTLVEDEDLIQELNGVTFTQFYSVAYTADATVSYAWTDKLPGTFIFATLADYETYEATHNVPIGSQIIIENETDYVYGDEING